MGVLAATVAPLLAACGRQEPAVRSPPGTPAPQTVKMTDQLRFVPERLTLKVGDTVIWRNQETVSHTVTSDAAKAADKTHASVPAGAESWDSGMIEGGKTFERKFEVAGEYTYFCIPHESAGMLGTLIVEE